MIVHAKGIVNPIESLFQEGGLFIIPFILSGPAAIIDKIMHGFVQTGPVVANTSFMDKSVVPSSGHRHFSGNFWAGRIKIIIPKPKLKINA
jgi:hypothetical protein